MQNITVIPPLNLQRPNTLVIAYGKQNDTKSRWYQAQLLSGDTPWLMPANTTGTIRFAKPDGHGGWYDSLENGTPAVTMSGSTVTMGLVTQVLTCPGDVKIDLMFADTSGSVLTAFSWTLRVEKNAIEDSLIEDSDDYFTILAGQVARVQAAAATVREVSAQGDSSVYVSNLADQHGEAIPAGSDLNSYTTPGAYYFGGGSTLANAPLSTSYRLEVMQITTAATSSYCVQFLYSTSTSRVFSRRLSGGTWSEWTRLLDSQSDLPLTIANGGTGAVNAAGAKENLGFKTMLSPYALLTPQAINTTSSTTYSTYDGRQFSDYQLLIFGCGTSSSSWRVTSIIPRVNWASGSSVYLSGHHGTNLAGTSSVAFTYASDTSVSISTDGDKGFTYAAIWGLTLT